MSVAVQNATIRVSGRIRAGVEELIDRSEENFTGSITIHFQDGIVREIEQHTRKRLKKGGSENGNI